MFCPRCGEERISEATSFCSKCGYLLTGTAELLQTGGTLVSASPTAGGTADGMVRAAWWSPRSLGIRRGLFLLLLAIVLAPLVGIISTFALGIEPWPVGVVIFLLGGGGLLRIVYALMFESKNALSLPASATDDLLTTARLSSPVSSLLSPSDPHSALPGGWLDTNDLEPRSVTDNTTKLLEKDS